MSAKRKPGKKGGKGKSAAEKNEIKTDPLSVVEDPPQGEDPADDTGVDVEVISGDPEPTTTDPEPTAADPESTASDSDDESEPPLELQPEQVEELILKLQEMQGLPETKTDSDRWREKEDSLLRVIAERDNQIRRLLRDQDRNLAFAKGKLMASMLDILDNFDRALESVPEDETGPFVEGMQLIATNLFDTLAALGLSVIEAMGEKFDPQYHEALMQINSDEAVKGTVAQVIQKGYLMDDQVLRPAKVAVAR